MKVISKTATGYLVDMKANEIAHIIDMAHLDNTTPFVEYSQIREERLLGAVINISGIWTRMHDHIRIKADLSDLRGKLETMLDKCRQAQPVAEELATLVEPGKKAKAA